MTLDDIVEESKAPTLTTQGSFTNAGKVGILIKLHSIKHGYHTQILHMTILHNRIKDNLSVSIYILKFLPGNVLQESRYREYGTGTKPAADMIEHRIVGDVEDIILQLLQASDAHDFLVGFRISEDEIAKPHVLLHQTAQVHTHLLGVLVHKAEAFCFCLGTVITLRTLKDKGHKRVILSDIAEKLQTCIRTFLTPKGICAILWFDFLFNFISKSFGCTFQRESGITDDSKGIIGILIIQFLRLFISTSQYHLRTTTHTHGGSMPVQGFLGEVLTLLQNIIIEVRQDGAIEADGILYKKNHLYTSLPDIMLKIHLILNQLDDGKNQVGITQPAEDIIEDAQILVLHSLGNAMREWSKNYTVNIRKLALDVTGHIKGIIIRITWHTDYQVDHSRTQYLRSLLRGRNLSKSRRITKTKFHILIIYLLLDSPIIFKHERIIRVSYNQHIVDTTHHKIDK